MKNLGIKLLIFLGIGFTLFLLSYPINTNHLIVDEQPVQSDVIIVPEGATPERARKSAQLLNEGYSLSDKIIVSPLQEENAFYYKKYGVNKAQVIPEFNATSTYENAVYTLEQMVDNEFTSAIVVSSDYHMRRVKLIYDRINKDYDFNLTYVAAYQQDDGEAVPWYNSSNSKKNCSV